MTVQTLYIFNPEHDLALASGEEHYMAPASARRMASELALLPMWYAEADSGVLAASAYNLDFLQQMKERFALPVTLVTEPELAELSWKDIRPWGWNAALRKRLLTQGVHVEMLPSLEQLSVYRAFSHRSKAVALLPQLQIDASFCGESHFFQQEDEWSAFIETHACCLLKAPLSGSGKGLNWCKGVLTPSIAGWCTRVSASQGGVIAEPVYNRVADFAMEFTSDGQGHVVWAGYSLFRTGKSGMYEGNELLSNEAIGQRLSAYVPSASLTALAARLSALLSETIGTFYTGFLGVDMMICQFDETDAPVYRIHPCVEINLRMNMGVLSRLFFDRYVCPSSSGSFGIDYYPSAGEALKQCECMTHAYPLVIQNGRIQSGYMPLVPVHKNSCYLAWVHITS